MKRTKERGITLIALVVTIIVLLILAGVTISLVLGQDGIFRKAETAKSEHIVAQEKELIGLAYSEYRMNKMDNESYTMQNALDAEKAGATAEGDETYGWDITFTDTGHQYTLNSNGSIDEGVAEKWDGVSKEEPVIDENRNWHIYNCAQMKFFADFVNGKLTDEEKGDLTITEDTVVYLEADLDLGARANNQGEKTVGIDWEPVGVSTESAFIGTFEGNNHYIKGVYVNLAGDFGGIFGNANTIQNLTVKDSYIKAVNCAGEITAVVREGNLENCHNSNTTVVAEESSAGGIVGQFSTTTDGVITNCSNTGSVSGKKQIGGIVGYTSTTVTISECSNSGVIEGTTQFIGGILGSAAGTSNNVSNCNNSGTILGKGTYVGGIVGGMNSSSSVSNSYNTGNITIEVTRNMGGVVGYVGQSGNVSNCYNTGKITATSDAKDTSLPTGGIVGEASYDTTISNSYNAGEIVGVANVGGCAGIIFGTIENCYNTGSVTANQSAGGVTAQIGKSSSGVITVGIKNCYNTGHVTSNETAGGIIGWISDTNTEGVIENVYNSGTIEVQAGSVGGLVGRHGTTINVRKGYNKGQIIYAEGVSAGAVIGTKEGDTSLVSNLYYLNNTDLPAIGNKEAPETVTSVEDDIPSYEDFLTWIEQKQ